MKMTTVAALSTLSLSLLTACSPTTTQTQPTAPGQVPEFTGPWAQQMAEDYQRSHSEFFHHVIADGVVTEAEFHESNEREAQCLRDKGFTGVVFNPDGTSEMDVRTDISREEEKALSMQCAEDTGAIDVAIWYDLLRSNPDNLDWPTGERDCLVKAGLLQPGTTVEEMNRWYEEDGEGSRSNEAHICSQDPFGKLGLQ